MIKVPFENKTYSLAIKSDQHSLFHDSIVKLKWTFILVATGLFFLSCSSSNFDKIELIAIDGRALHHNQTDSLILCLILRSYAQIDEKGNCNIIIKLGENKDSRKFNSFTIDPALFRTIRERLNTIHTDTSLMTECLNFYDGPEIALWVYKKDGRKHKLNFIDSKESDRDFLKLYKYINSVGLNEMNGKSLDTLKFLGDLDTLIRKIKREEIRAGNTFGRDTIVVIK